MQSEMILCVHFIEQDNIKNIFDQRGKPYPLDLIGVQNLLKLTSYTAVVSVLCMNSGQPMFSSI